MRLRILLPILVLLLIPMPLALLFGMFVDYADAANRRYLPYHPGYYYHYWNPSSSSPYRSTGGRTTGTAFRGGGPAFGK